MHSMKSPLDREALEAAKKALTIRDVYFRDERVVMHPEVTPAFLPDLGRTQFRMTTSILRDFEVEDPDDDVAERSRYLEIEFKGHVRILSAASEEAEATELVLMEVSLGLLYFVKGECPQASVDEFVRMNTPFHAIPYWREHVHATCCKRRFPPVTVPLYARLRAEAKDAVDAASGREAADS